MLNFFISIRNTIASFIKKCIRTIRESDILKPRGQIGRPEGKVKESKMSKKDAPKKRELSKITKYIHINKHSWRGKS